MAKKLEKKMPEAPRIISKDQFHKVYRRFTAARAELREAKGKMGSVSERAAVDENLHLDAFRQLVKYAEKPAPVRANFILNAMKYFEYWEAAAAEDEAAPKKRRGRPPKRGIKGNSDDRVRIEAEGLDIMH